MARRTGMLAVFAAVLALVLAVAAPVALAHHKDDHAQGGGKPSSGEETVTEDNDDDGVDNAPDPEGDADNKHPSGKDKHEEGGGSGNQGKAKSDPDDDGRGPDRSNGGVDQPGGSGGEDKLDQDGNNGCGNDDDFEDDNEGWCGKPTDVERGAERQFKPLPPDVAGEVITQPEQPEVEVTEDAVLGIRVTAAPAAPAVAPAAVAPAAVAPAVGAAAETEGGGVLPFTGAADLVPLLTLGMLLIVAGALVLRARKATN